MICAEIAEIPDCPLDTGQRNLVRHAKHEIVIEGYSIYCAAYMMQRVPGDLQPEVIIADSLYDMDGDYFGINYLPEEHIRSCVEMAAGKVGGSACSSGSILKYHLERIIKRRGYFVLPTRRELLPGFDPAPGEI